MAKEYDIAYVQGDTYGLGVTFEVGPPPSGPYTPVDLTNAYIALAVKSSATDVTPKILISTTTGDIIIDSDPTTGVFTIVIPSNATLNWTGLPNAIYDCVVEIGAYRQTVLYGSFKLFPTLGE